MRWLNWGRENKNFIACECTCVHCRACEIDRRTEKREGELFFLRKIADSELNLYFCGFGTLYWFHLNCSFQVMPMRLFRQYALILFFLYAQYQFSHGRECNPQILFILKANSAAFPLLLSLLSCTRTPFLPNIGYGELAGCLLRVREAFIGRTSKPWREFYYTF